MHFLRAALALAPLLALSGCGYIHFGRLPATAALTGDAALVTAYSNLSTEHKILQQELLLARKEGAALRTALESRSVDGTASPELAARLNEATRELATLRASYAKLQASRASPPAAAAATDPAVQDKLTDLENQLAASLHNYTQLQEENVRLRGEVDQTRTENTTLAAQVKTIAAKNEETQAALAQLNTELLAQKDARARAEQQTAAVRAQLSAVIARPAGPELGRPERAGVPRSDPAPTLAGARDTSADSAATLRLAQAPPSDAPSTAELRTSLERLHALQSTATPTPAPRATAAPAAPGPRTHIVQAGDTLEKIAKKYYNNPDRWRAIYAANNAQLSGGRPLKLGMELEIPEE